MPRAPMLLIALCLIGCPQPDPVDDDDATDDDDAAGDDDDAADDDDSVADDDDDDDSVPCGVVLSGDVIALDRESGAVLTDGEYAARAGGLILYILPDPDDLSVIFTKDTMTGPGAWSAGIEDCSGSASVVAVVDEDRDFVIGPADIAREHAFNPVLLPANGKLTGINVYVDLPRVEDDSSGDDDDDASGPGDDDDDQSGDDDDQSGPGDDDDDDDQSSDDDDTSNPADDDDSTPWNCPSLFTGDVEVTDLPNAPVVVTANSADLLDGPWAVTYLDQPGEWALDVPCGADLTSFVGILDADENLFFEPSDPVGSSENNPWTMGLPSTTGVHIEIPGSEDVSAPAPEPYGGITGQVVFDDFLTGDILVFATAVHPGGQVYSSATLAAPGPFSLIAPPEATDVLVWAVLDDDADGSFDVFADPYDSVGPGDMADGLTGLTLDLSGGPPEPGTITGHVLFPDGASTGADCQRVGLFDVEPIALNAVPFTAVAPGSGPSWPYLYTFVNIPPGQYWVGAYLDIDCDSAQGPDEDDIDGRTAWPVQLTDGGALSGVDVLLEP